MRFIFAFALAAMVASALADTTSSDHGAPVMEQRASPSNPVRQDEERTEAHSQPTVPQDSAASNVSHGAQAGSAQAGAASAGASAPSEALPSTHAANRANNGYYYQSGEFNEIHPEEAVPNNLPRLEQPGDDSQLIRQVQQRLRARGFDAGPANGDFGAKTQAALAQFQLAQSLPVSGSLDPRTLLELGVEFNPPARPSP